VLELVDAALDEMALLVEMPVGGGRGDREGLLGMADEFTLA
jgi:hypothetical protein